ncbi:Synaptotagmin-like protein 3 [Microtus ochrogaster]|uniref:Synaptotagmin-like protein 3 n=1 Tax=Microtus ochrogaster TaxID=79684 RepID=A0A8J6H1R5_MICOH|nr:Synaptotagmin-like protein 3 [Microtus ochrogaster]
MAHEVDLESFKELEREVILGVLYRDRAVQSIEEERIRKLKTHLQHLRWKGAKSSSQEYRAKCCARCQRALGLLLNRGAVCQGCSHRVCSECRKEGSLGSCPVIELTVGCCALKSLLR